MKRIAAGLLCSLFLIPLAVRAQDATPSASPSASPSPAPATAVVTETLANGMRVVLLPNKLAPVVSTVMTYGVGSDDDTMPGIAHATEHMMFRGTKDLSAGQLADLSARAGGDYDAFTTSQYTEYYFTLPSAYAGLALRVEADRMTGALERASDWNVERGAIEQEVKAQQSVPGWSIGQRVRRIFFGDTPYANDTVGTVASFDKMTASDIASFYHTWYHPNNATLVIAGDVDPQKILAQVHALFDPIASVALPQRKPVTVQPLPTTTISDKIDVPVPFVVNAYRFPGTNDSDYAASQVLIAALDNGRSALTDLTVQGKVLAALATGGSFPEVGTAQVIGVARPGSDPATAQSAISSVIDAYTKDGVPQELVDAAKTRILSQQSYREASISGLARDWASSFGEGESSPDAIYDAIAKVSADDVNRVLRTYFVADHQISLVMRPNSVNAIPKVDPNAGVENVKYTPTVHEPLPAWTTAYFNAPLRAPQHDGKLQTLHLPNGITLTVRHEAFSPTVVVEGEIRNSPELYEPLGKSGVADVTSDLLSWGTTTYDRKAYQAQLDAVAASVRLGTSFAMTVQSKDFDRAMQLLADGELHPALPEPGFLLIQQNDMQSLAAVEGRPQTQAEIARTNALYPVGDPRRRRATAKTISTISLKDVKKWYSFAYRPDLTAIAIVGDVTPEQARATVEKYFGDWKATGRKPTFELPVITSAAKTQSVTVKSQSNAQSQVTLTQVIRVHRGDPDYIPLQLANTILSGEGPGSLLFHDLREEKGYVYTVDSSMDVGRSSSTFSIDFASDPKNVAKAQAAAVADIKRLQTVALPNADLQRAKALLLASSVLPLDSYGGVADDLLADAEVGYTPADADWYWKALLSTTPEQLRDAMRRWVNPQHFVRVIIAPD